MGSEGSKEEDDQDDGGGEMDVDEYALSSRIRYCGPQSQMGQGEHCGELDITTDKKQHPKRPCGMWSPVKAPKHQHNR